VPLENTDVHQASLKDFATRLEVLILFYTGVMDPAPRHTRGKNLLRPEVFYNPRETRIKTNKEL
jgi:hypothetical protein